MVAIVRDKQREETRRRLYVAALQVFRRDGVANCRIDDIAKIAEVSRAAFYFHFPTKDDVLVELMRVAGEAVASRVAAVPADASLADVLAETTRALADLWKDDPRILPDLATVALKQTAEALSDQEANPLRSTLSRRFRVAGERGELVSLLAPPMLSDLYLANVLAAMLAWCAHTEVPLLTVLEGVTVIFLGGAASSSVDEGS